VEIRGARLGLGVVHLTGVTVSSAEVSRVTALISHLDVAPGFSLSARRIEVHGGSVRVHGSPADLDVQATAWLHAHAGPGGARPSSSERSVASLSVDGIDVEWTGLTPSAPAANAWGARYERHPDGHEAVGADLVRVALEGARIEAVEPRAELEREGTRRIVREVSARGLSAGIDVDALSAAVRPRHDPLPRPAASTSNSTAGPIVSTGAGAPGPWLRAELSRAARATASLLASPGTLALSGVRFEIEHEGQALNVGPAAVVLQRNGDGVRLGVTSGAGDAAAPLRFELTVPLGRGTVEIGLAGGPVSLAALGVKEHDLGLEDVRRAVVEVDGHASLSEDGTSLTVLGRSRLADLSLFNPRLAGDAVSGIRLALAGRTEMKLDGSHLHFEDVDAAFGKVKLGANGDLDREGGHAVGKLHVEIPLASCADMLASIPPALVPLLRGLEVTGTFAFAGDLAFDTRRPGDTTVDWDVASECRATKIPEGLSPARFARPWVRTVVGPTDLPTTIETGPGTPTWVPYLDISPYLATAVVVCEDANFWVHEGFNGKSIRDSIRDDLRTGKFLRGGSTVSMQLAKNLYLGREKTLSRKLQEAVLTLLLEQALTKEQILELYLNVIEFAPGLYGIGPAAEHYFNTKPRDLSAAQAFYLISILPNPKLHHFAADGLLTPAWADYLRHLMGIARKIHRIDDHELELGLAETVRFGAPATTATAGAPEAARGSASPAVLELAPDEPPPQEAEGP
jgi:hypothetical protein